MSSRKTKCRYCKFLSDEVMPDGYGDTCIEHSCHRFLDEGCLDEWHILSASEMKRGCKKYRLNRIFYPELIGTELDDKPGLF